MNDKTYQSLTDALRLAVQLAAPHGTTLIGVGLLNEAADALENLQTQLTNKTAQVERVKQQRDRMLEWEMDGTLKQRFWDAAVEQEQEITRLKAERDELKAARIAYANEFPLNADGEPDVGNIHANIRSLKAQLAEAERGIIAKEAERAAMELERNNAQRQHTTQCAINKTDSQRILELTTENERMRAQLAEAQKDSERLDWMIEQCAYVVSDPDCCDGYWLNYPRKDGTLWVQTTEHETPRAAIDAAKSAQ